MTFDDNLTDESLLTPQRPTQQGDGVNPVNESGVDYERAEFMRELEQQLARQLTGDEKRADAPDTGSAMRVYAPASERIAVDPLPGDREIVDHLDTLTSERRAAKSQTQQRGFRKSEPASHPN
jgi:hypothetical protein